MRQRLKGLRDPGMGVPERRTVLGRAGNCPAAVELPWGGCSVEQRARRRCPARTPAGLMLAVDPRWKSARRAPAAGYRQIMKLLVIAAGVFGAGVWVSKRLLDAISRYVNPHRPD